MILAAILIEIGQRVDNIPCIRLKSRPKSGNDSFRVLVQWGLEALHGITEGQTSMDEKSSDLTGFFNQLFLNNRQNLPQFICTFPSTRCNIHLDGGALIKYELNEVG